LVAYEVNAEVKVIKSTQVKEFLISNLITAHTLVFDNTITESAQLQTKWKLPLQSSWLAKYL
jgi:hypothetical protein